jgi:hypothetical protein
MDTAIALRLEHIFDVRIDFGERFVFGPVPGGASQGYTPPYGGRIEGPRLNGRVVPHSGADYATVRSDGVIDLNAHYLLQTEDGTYIYIANRGYIVPAPGGARSAQPRYFVCTPTFKVPVGPHDWLARTVIVGSERHANPDHTIFRYYAVMP